MTGVANCALSFTTFADPTNSGCGRFGKEAPEPFAQRSSRWSLLTEN
jgi:hypothetical protein